MQQQPTASESFLPSLRGSKNGEGLQLQAWQRYSLLLLPNPERRRCHLQNIPASPPQREEWAVLEGAGGLWGGLVYPALSASRPPETGSSLPSREVPPSLCGGRRWREHRSSQPPRALENMRFVLLHPAALELLHEALELLLRLFQTNADPFPSVGLKMLCRRRPSVANTWVFLLAAA